MGRAEVTRLLSSLAVEGRVAASTQNQALSALLFLYRDVLGVELPWLDEVVRARRPTRLPVVLTREEVRAVIERLGNAAASGPGRQLRIYTHVLNRGPAGVRSPVDQMFSP
jgi:integrase